MIKEHFHAQNPNPTSLAHSFPQYAASAQSNTASLKTITDMLLLFPTSLLLVNALHSLRLLVLTLKNCADFGNLWYSLELGQTSVHF